jgi:hypothetical protein
VAAVDLDPSHQGSDQRLLASPIQIAQPIPYPGGELFEASGATSLRQIAAALNERHIRTAQGKEWTATQVMRVLGQEKAPLGSL